MDDELRKRGTSGDRFGRSCHVIARPRRELGPAVDEARHHPRLPHEVFLDEIGSPASALVELGVVVVPFLDQVAPLLRDLREPAMSWAVDHSVVRPSGRSIAPTRGYERN